MSRIAISACGEGRGHASRVMCLIEELYPRHEILVLSFGEGFDQLDQYIKKNKHEISLFRISGVTYKYNNFRLSPLRTYLHWASFFLLRLSSECQYVDRIISRFSPQLAITDFEPCLPRVAKRRGIRCISIDHQHILRFFNIWRLPIKLAIRCFIGSFVCKIYVPNADLYVVSSFFKEKLPRKSTKERVMQVGPIVRKDIRSADVSDSGTIVSYLRKKLPSNLLQAFLAAGLPVIVYGLGRQKDISNITFKGFSIEEFVSDLSRATVVIGAAGNQLLGESLYLGKPYYALPEENHHEQIVNSILLERMGLGTSSRLESFKEKDLNKFLQNRYNKVHGTAVEESDHGSLEFIVNLIQEEL